MMRARPQKKLCTGSYAFQTPVKYLSIILDYFNILVFF
jgi:hypothetical protein